MGKFIGISGTSGRPVYLKDGIITTGCFEGNVSEFIKKAARERKDWVLELDGFSAYSALFKEHLDRSSDYWLNKISDVADITGASVECVEPFLFEVRGNELLPFNQFLFYLKER